MNEQEVRDLWGAVNGLRVDVGGVATQVAQVMAMLGERCVSREQRIAAVERQFEEMERRVDALERRVVRMGMVTGAVTALLSSAATALCLKMLKLLF
jgi:phage shock protein A